MISSQIIKTSIEELKTISKIDMAVWDLEGKVVVATGADYGICRISCGQSGHRHASSDEGVG